MGNNSDKRSVSTDALETLGTIIDANQRRDAIHLAVIPAIASERLAPGSHVDKNGFHRQQYCAEAVGIVDPFLKEVVHPGEHFWLVIYPRVITSLRHVWTHPAFEAEPIGYAAPVAVDKAASEQWLRQFCETADCPSYERVMLTITEGNSDTFDADYLHFDGYDAHGEIPREFWDHVEVVLGHRVDHRSGHFSCSC